MATVPNEAKIFTEQALIGFGTLAHNREKKIMEFEITRGIPLPRGRGKPRKYDLPLDSMELGDHCHIGMPKTKIAQEVRIIRNFVLRYRHKNPNKKFTVRQMEDGVGIWRL